MRSYHNNSQQLSYVLLFFLCTLFSCSPSTSSKVILLADEKEMETLDATVGINFFKKDITVDFKAENTLRSYLGNGDIKELFQYFFRSKFAQAVTNRTVFNKVRTTEIRDDSLGAKFQASTRKVSGDALKMKEPKEGTIFDTGKEKLRYLLFIGDFRIEKDENYYAMPNMGGVVQDFSKVHYGFQFYLWDNAKGKMLFFGKAKNHLNSGTGAGGMDMNAMLDEFAMQVFEESPFLYKGK